MDTRPYPKFAFNFTTSKTLLKPRLKHAKDLDSTIQYALNNLAFDKEAFRMQKRLVKLKKSDKYRAPLIPRNSKFLQAICSSKHQRPTTPHLGHHYIKIPKGHPNEKRPTAILQKENVFQSNLSKNS